MESFFTLNDFMVHVKGVSYLVAGVLLTSFVVFWYFLTEREK